VWPLCQSGYCRSRALLSPRYAPRRMNTKLQLCAIESNKRYPNTEVNCMVLIQNKDQSGVSFWYPFGFRPRRSGEVVKIIDWASYRKWLRLRAILKIVLIAFGLLLFSDRIYTDDRYNLFALVVLLSTAASVWAFIPRRTIPRQPP
jgi:hypothetical protein